jgi:hypothetical protein
MLSPVINACTLTWSPRVTQSIKNRISPIILAALLHYLQVPRTPIVSYGPIRKNHNELNSVNEEAMVLIRFFQSIHLENFRLTIPLQLLHNVGAHHQVSTTYRALLSGVRPLKDLLIYFLISPTNVHQLILGVINDADPNID